MSRTHGAPHRPRCGLCQPHKNGQSHGNRVGRSVAAVRRACQDEVRPVYAATCSHGDDCACTVDPARLYESA